MLALLAFAAADVVLLRHTHGADRHRDVIECVQSAAPADALFSEERLLAPIVLPDALWCDDARRCHDRTSGREYVAASLECNETASVRCTLRIDCTEYIAAFWQSLLTTLAGIFAFIVVPGVCLADERRRADYDKDRTL